VPAADPGAGPAGGGRSALAQRQEALVRALVAGGPVPPGLDPARVAVTADGLARKRARGVAALWPALRLVPDYEGRFATWAAGLPPGDAHAEGPAFARSLPRDALPAAVGVELAAAGRRRCIRVRGGLVLRVPLLGVRQLGGR
jgi:hypothetical protein